MSRGLFKLPVVGVLFNTRRPVAPTATAKSQFPRAMKLSGSHSAREGHFTTGLWRSTSALRSIGVARTAGANLSRRHRSAKSARRIVTKEQLCRSGRLRVRAIFSRRAPQLMTEVPDAARTVARVVALTWAATGISAVFEPMSPALMVIALSRSSAPAPVARQGVSLVVVRDSGACLPA
jgi:hypothetical protein